MLAVSLHARQMPRSGPLDARVQKTHRKLLDALVELVSERGYDAVTVRDLTERAGVGYATFFRHFSSKEALLERLLEDTLASLLGGLELPLQLEPRETGTRVFRHASDHADRYRVLLHTGEVTGLLARCTQLSTEILSKTALPKPESVVPFEVAAHHLVYSFVGLIAWYLDAGTPHTPERMGEILEQLILKPTYAAALEPVAQPA